MNSTAKSKILLIFISFVLIMSVALGFVCGITKYNTFTTKNSIEQDGNGNNSNQGNSISGTAANDAEIALAAESERVRLVNWLTNNQSADGYSTFTLTRDITWTDYRRFHLYRNKVIDGAGFTITLTPSADYADVNSLQQGIFINHSRGTIQNVKFVLSKSFEFRFGTANDVGATAGVVTAVNFGTISNCTLTISSGINFISHSNYSGTTWHHTNTGGFAGGNTTEGGNEPAVGIIKDCTMNLNGKIEARVARQAADSSGSLGAFAGASNGGHFENNVLNGNGTLRVYGVNNLGGNTNGYIGLLYGTNRNYNRESGGQPLPTVKGFIVNGNISITSDWLSRLLKSIISVNVEVSRLSDIYVSNKTSAWDNASSQNNKIHRFDEVNDLTNLHFDNYGNMVADIPCDANQVPFTVAGIEVFTQLKDSVLSSAGNRRVTWPKLNRNPVSALAQMVITRAKVGTVNASLAGNVTRTYGESLLSKNIFNGLSYYTDSSCNYNYIIKNSNNQPVNNSNYLPVGTYGVDININSTDPTVIYLDRTNRELVYAKSYTDNATQNRILTISKRKINYSVNDNNPLNLIYNGQTVQLARVNVTGDLTGGKNFEGLANGSYSPMPNNGYWTTTPDIGEGLSYVTQIPNSVVSVIYTNKRDINNNLDPTWIMAGAYEIYFYLPGTNRDSSTTGITNNIEDWKNYYVYNSTANNAIEDGTGTLQQMNVAKRQLSYEITDKIGDAYKVYYQTKNVALLGITIRNDINSNGGVADYTLARQIGDDYDHSSWADYNDNSIDKNGLPDSSGNYGKSKVYNIDSSRVKVLYTNKRNAAIPSTLDTSWIKAGSYDMYLYLSDEDYKNFSIDPQNSHIQNIKFNVTVGKLALDFDWLTNGISNEYDPNGLKFTGGKFLINDSVAAGIFAGEVPEFIVAGKDSIGSYDENSNTYTRIGIGAFSGVSYVLSNKKEYNLTNGQIDVIDKDWSNAGNYTITITIRAVENFEVSESIFGAFGVDYTNYDDTTNADTVVITRDNSLNTITKKAIQFEWITNGADSLYTGNTLNVVGGKVTQLKDGNYVDWAGMSVSSHVLGGAWDATSNQVVNNVFTIKYGTKLNSKNIAEESTKNAGSYVATVAIDKKNFDASFSNANIGGSDTTADISTNTHLSYNLTKKIEKIDAEINFNLNDYFVNNYWDEIENNGVWYYDFILAKKNYSESEYNTKLMALMKEILNSLSFISGSNLGKDIGNNLNNLQFASTAPFENAYGKFTTRTLVFNNPSEEIVNNYNNIIKINAVNATEDNKIVDRANIQIRNLWANTKNYTVGANAENNLNNLLSKRYYSNDTNYDGVTDIIIQSDLQLTSFNSYVLEKYMTIDGNNSSISYSYGNLNVVDSIISTVQSLGVEWYAFGNVVGANYGEIKNLIIKMQDTTNKNIVIGAIGKISNIAKNTAFGLVVGFNKGIINGVTLELGIDFVVNANGGDYLALGGIVGINDGGYLIDCTVDINGQSVNKDINNGISVEGNGNYLALGGAVGIFSGGVTHRIIVKGVSQFYNNSVKGARIYNNSSVTNAFCGGVFGIINIGKTNIINDSDIGIDIIGLKIVSVSKKTTGGYDISNIYSLVAGVISQGYLTGYLAVINDYQFDKWVYYNKELIGDGDKNSNVRVYNDEIFNDNNYSAFEKLLSKDNRIMSIFGKCADVGNLPKGVTGVGLNDNGYGNAGYLFVSNINVTNITTAPKIVINVDLPIGLTDGMVSWIDSANNIELLNNNEFGLGINKNQITVDPIGSGTTTKWANYRINYKTTISNVAGSQEGVDYDFNSSQLFNFVNGFGYANSGLSAGAKYGQIVQNIEVSKRANGSRVMNERKTLDGNGYTVNSMLNRDLNANSGWEFASGLVDKQNGDFTAQYNGIYGVSDLVSVNKGIIKSLTVKLDNSENRARLLDISAYNKYSLGLIAGINLGVIDNCSAIFNEEYQIYGYSGHDIYFGGLVGYNVGKISSDSGSNKVDINYNPTGAGSAGANDYATEGIGVAATYGGNNIHVGGAVGYNNGSLDNIDVNFLNNNNNVIKSTTAGNTYIGGIVGKTVGVEGKNSSLSKLLIIGKGRFSSSSNNTKLGGIFGSIDLKYYADGDNYRLSNIVNLIEMPNNVVVGGNTMAWHTLVGGNIDTYILGTMYNIANGSRGYISGETSNIVSGRNFGNIMYINPNNYLAPLFSIGTNISALGVGKLVDLNGSTLANGTITGLAGIYISDYANPSKYVDYLNANRLNVNQYFDKFGIDKTKVDANGKPVWEVTARVKENSTLGGTSNNEFKKLSINWDDNSSKVNGNVAYINAIGIVTNKKYSQVDNGQDINGAGIANNYVSGQLQLHINYRMEFGATNIASGTTNPNNNFIKFLSSNGGSSINDKNIHGAKLLTITGTNKLRIDNKANAVVVLAKGKIVRGHGNLVENHYGIDDEDMEGGENNSTDVVYNKNNRQSISVRAGGSFIAINYGTIDNINYRITGNSNGGHGFYFSGYTGAFAYGLLAGINYGTIKNSGTMADATYGGINAVNNSEGYVGVVAGINLGTITNTIAGVAATDGSRWYGVRGTLVANGLCVVGGLAAVNGGLLNGEKSGEINNSKTLFYKNNSYLYNEPAGGHRVLGGLVGINNGGKLDALTVEGNGILMFEKQALSSYVSPAIGVTCMQITVDGNGNDTNDAGDISVGGFNLMGSFYKVADGTYESKINNILNKFTGILERRANDSVIYAGIIAAYANSVNVIKKNAFVQIKNAVWTSNYQKYNQMYNNDIPRIGVNPIPVGNNTGKPFGEITNLSVLGRVDYRAEDHNFTGNHSDYESPLTGARIEVNVDNNSVTWEYNSSNEVVGLRVMSNVGSNDINKPVIGVDSPELKLLDDGIISPTYTVTEESEIIVEVEKFNGQASTVECNVYIDKTTDISWYRKSDKTGVFARPIGTSENENDPVTWEQFSGNIANLIIQTKIISSQEKEYVGRPKTNLEADDYTVTSVNNYYGIIIKNEYLSTLDFYHQNLAGKKDIDLYILSIRFKFVVVVVTIKEELQEFISERGDRLFTYYNEGQKRTIKFSSAAEAKLGNDLVLGAAGDTTSWKDLTNTLEFKSGRTLDGDGKKITLAIKQKGFTNVQQIYVPEILETPSRSGNMRAVSAFIPIMRGTLKNINFVYSGEIGIYAGDVNTQWRQDTTLYTGIVSGYTSGTIDGCSLVMEDNSYIFTSKRLTDNAKDDWPAYASSAVAGYAPLLANGGIISNSTFHMGKNTALACVQSGDWQYKAVPIGYRWGDVKAWAGGFAGYMGSNSNIYNVTITGDKTSAISATAPGYYEGGDDRTIYNSAATLAGGIAGCNTNDGTYNPWGVYGTIDGVIFNWAGSAITFDGAKKEGGGTTTLAGGRAVGASANTNASRNIYYTFPIDYYINNTSLVREAKQSVKGDKEIRLKLGGNEIESSSDDAEYLWLNVTYSGKGDFDDWVTGRWRGNWATPANVVGSGQLDYKIIPIYKLDDEHKGPDFIDGQPVMKKDTTGYYLLEDLGNILTWVGRDKGANLALTFEANKENTSIIWSVKLMGADYDDSTGNRVLINKNTDYLKEDYYYKKAKSQAEILEENTQEFIVPRGVGTNSDKTIGTKENLGIRIFVATGRALSVRPNADHYAVLKEDSGVQTVETKKYYAHKPLQYDSFTTADGAGIEFVATNADGSQEVVKLEKSIYDAILNNLPKTISREDGGQTADLTQVGEYQVLYTLEGDENNYNATVNEDGRVIFFPSNPKNYTTPGQELEKYLINAVISPRKVDMNNLLKKYDGTNGLFNENNLVEFNFTKENETLLNVTTEYSREADGSIKITYTRNKPAEEAGRPTGPEVNIEYIYFDGAFSDVKVSNSNKVLVKTNTLFEFKGIKKHPIRGEYEIAKVDTRTIARVNESYIPSSAENASKKKDYKTNYTNYTCIGGIRYHYSNDVVSGNPIPYINEDFEGNEYTADYQGNISIKASVLPFEFDIRNIYKDYDGNVDLYNKNSNNEWSSNKIEYEATTPDPSNSYAIVEFNKASGQIKITFRVVDLRTNTVIYEEVETIRIYGKYEHEDVKYEGNAINFDTKDVLTYYIDTGGKVEERKVVTLGGGGTNGVGGEEVNYTIKACIDYGGTRGIEHVDGCAGCEIVAYPNSQNNKLVATKAKILPTVVDINSVTKTYDGAMSINYAGMVIKKGENDVNIKPLGSYSTAKAEANKTLIMDAHLITHTKIGETTPTNYYNLVESSGGVASTLSSNYAIIVGIYDELTFDSNKKVVSIKKSTFTITKLDLKDNGIRNATLTSKILDNENSPNRPSTPPKWVTGGTLGTFEFAISAIYTLQFELKFKKTDLASKTNIDVTIGGRTFTVGEHNIIGEAVDDTIDSNSAWVKYQILVTRDDDMSAHNVGDNKPITLDFTNDSNYIYDGNCAKYTITRQEVTSDRIRIQTQFAKNMQYNAPSGIPDFVQPVKIFIVDKYDSTVETESNVEIAKIVYGANKTANPQTVGAYQAFARTFDIAKTNYSIADNLDVLITIQTGNSVNNNGLYIIPVEAELVNVNKVYDGSNNIDYAQNTKIYWKNASGQSLNDTLNPVGRFAGINVGQYNVIFEEENFFYYDTQGNRVEVSRLTGTNYSLKIGTDTLDKGYIIPKEVELDYVTKEYDSTTDIIYGTERTEISWANGLINGDLLLAKVKVDTPNVGICNLTFERVEFVYYDGTEQKISYQLVAKSSVGGSDENSNYTLIGDGNINVDNKGYILPKELQLNYIHRIYNGSEDILYVADGAVINWIDVKTLIDDITLLAEVKFNGSNVGINGLTFTLGTFQSYEQDKLIYRLRELVGNTYVDSNYTIKGANSTSWLIEGKGLIRPKEVTFNVADKVYNGNTDITTAITTIGAIGNVNLSVTGAYDERNVGNRIISWNNTTTTFTVGIENKSVSFSHNVLEGEGNYCIADGYTTSAKILAKIINKSQFENFTFIIGQNIISNPIEYGMNRFYEKSDIKGVVNAGNIIAKSNYSNITVKALNALDEFNFVITFSNSVDKLHNAGAYTITITFTSDNYALSENYTFSQNITKQIVTADRLNITIEDISRVYGSVNYNKPNITMWNTFNVQITDKYDSNYIKNGVKNDFGNIVLEFKRLGDIGTSSTISPIDGLYIGGYQVVIKTMETYLANFVIINGDINITANKLGENSNGEKLTYYITPAVLNISLIEKVYNGTTTISDANITYSGLVNNDNMLVLSGYYKDRNVASNKLVGLACETIVVDGRTYYLLKDNNITSNYQITSGSPVIKDGYEYYEIARGKITKYLIEYATFELGVSGYSQDANGTITYGEKFIGNFVGANTAQFIYADGYTYTSTLSLKNTWYNIDGLDANKLFHEEDSIVFAFTANDVKNAQVEDYNVKMLSANSNNYEIIIASYSEVGKININKQKLKSENVAFEISQFINSISGASFTNAQLKEEIIKSLSLNFVDAAVNKQISETIKEDELQFTFNNGGNDIAEPTEIGGYKIKIVPSSITMINYQLDLAPGANYWANSEEYRYYIIPIEVNVEAYKNYDGNQSFVGAEFVTTKGNGESAEDVDLGFTPSGMFASPNVVYISPGVFGDLKLNASVFEYRNENGDLVVIYRLLNGVVASNYSVVGTNYAADHVELIGKGVIIPKEASVTSISKEYDGKTTIDYNGDLSKRISKSTIVSSIADLRPMAIYSDKYGTVDVVFNSIKMEYTINGNVVVYYLIVNGSVDSDEKYNYCITNEGDFASNTYTVVGIGNISEFELGDNSSGALKAALENFKFFATVENEVSNSISVNVNGKITYNQRYKYETKGVQGLVNLSDDSNHSVDVANTLVKINLFDKTDIITCTITIKFEDTIISSAHDVKMYSAWLKLEGDRYGTSEVEIGTFTIEKQVLNKNNVKVQTGKHSKTYDGKVVANVSSLGAIVKAKDDTGYDINITSWVIAPEMTFVDNNVVNAGDYIMKVSVKLTNNNNYTFNEQQVDIVDSVLAENKYTIHKKGISNVQLVKLFDSTALFVLEGISEEEVIKEWLIIKGGNVSGSITLEATELENITIVEIRTNLNEKGKPDAKNYSLENITVTINPLKVLFNYGTKSQIEDNVNYGNNRIDSYRNKDIAKPIMTFTIPTLEELRAMQGFLTIHSDDEVNAFIAIIDSYIKALTIDTLEHLGNKLIKDEDGKYSAKFLEYQELLLLNIFANGDYLLTTDEIDPMLILTHYYVNAEGKFIIETFNDFAMLNSSENGQINYGKYHYVVTKNINGKSRIISPIKFSGSISGANKVGGTLGEDFTISNFIVKGVGDIAIFAENSGTIENLRFTNVIIHAMLPIPTEGNEQNVALGVLNNFSTVQDDDNNIIVKDGTVKKIFVEGEIFGHTASKVSNNYVVLNGNTAEESMSLVMANVMIDGVKTNRVIILDGIVLTLENSANQLGKFDSTNDWRKAVLNNIVKGNIIRNTQLVYNNSKLIETDNFRKRYAWKNICPWLNTLGTDTSGISELEGLVA